LSDFVRHQGTCCDLSGSDSWVILSGIEQSIKRKIEVLGKPLKDWDVNIYRGVLTGCNSAFIISEDERIKILNSCENDEERRKTDEIIRPILRGRDIKRYGYKWAGIYLIATFPSCHYNLDEYPSVKNYFLSFAKDKLNNNGHQWITKDYLSDFCKQKLSQTGKFVELDGKRVRLANSDEKARKKTNNKWFETQDSISYWEDFNKPKIIYIEIMTDNIDEGYPFPCFSYDEANKIILNTGYIMTSDSCDVRYILGILNSSLGRFLVKLYVSQLQSRQFRMLAQYVERFPIPMHVDKESYERIISLTQIMLDSNGKTNSNQVSLDLDKCVYNLYGITQEEIKCIESF